MNGEHPNSPASMSTDRMTCPICTGPKQVDEPECSVCRDEPKPEAYTAILETEACARCHEGETWTVKGPDGLCIGQSWAGDEAQCNALETAEMLNGAFEAGKRSAAAPDLLSFVIRIAEFADYTHDEVNELQILKDLQRDASALVAKAEGRS